MLGTWETPWKLKKQKIFLSPWPKFGVLRVEIGPIESRHYYRQDVKYYLMNFVFGQSKGILWGKVSKVIKPFSWSFCKQNGFTN
jgi:hypothetical protein